HRVFTYDRDGNLLTASNSAGRYTMTYDGDRLVTQTDPSGVSLSFGYDNNANVTSVTDNQGGTVASSYDAQGNLLSRTLTAPQGAQMRENFGYDGNGNVQTETRYSDTAGTHKVGSRTFRYNANRLNE